jgi:hypothetical protein
VGPDRASGTAGDPEAVVEVGRVSEDATFDRIFSFVAGLIVAVGLCLASRSTTHEEMRLLKEQVIQQNDFKHRVILYATATKDSVLMSLLK